MTHTLTLPAAVLLLLPFTLPAQSSRIAIKVNDPRPVAAAVRELENRYGVVITYEDPYYLHPSQFDDVTEKFAKRPGGQRIIVPRPRDLSIDVNALGNSTEQINAALATLVASAAPSSGGAFTYQAFVGGYHVTPTFSLDKAGAIKPHRPLLDSRITLTREDENGLSGIERIAAALTKSTGRKVVVGAIPTTLFGRTRVSVHAQKEPARDVLWGFAKSIHPMLSWRFLCAPGNDTECVINMHVVRKPR